MGLGVGRGAIRARGLPCLGDERSARREGVLSSARREGLLASVLGAARGPFCLCRVASASAFLGVSRVPSGLGPRGPAGLGSPPPSLGPKGDRYLGFAAGSRVPQVAWGEAELRLQPRVGNPAGSTFLFSLMCLGPTVRAREGGGTNRCDMGLNLSGSWQQGHSATYNTPSAYLSRLQRIQIAARSGIVLQGGPRRLRRADIEGSKSNVAMNGLAATSRLSLCSEVGCSTPGKAPKGRSRSVPGRARDDQLSAQREQLRAVHRQPTGWGLGPRAQPSSQSFSGFWDPFCRLPLPTLFHRPEGCSPWRPDAVMSTTRRGRHSVLRIFKGRRGRTGHHATCGALPAAGPYLRLSRFQGGQAICTDGRSARASRPRFSAAASALLLIEAWLLPDGGYGSQQLKAHPFSGLVDSAVSLRASTRVSSGFAPLRHSSPSFGSRQGDPANQLPCALRVWSPADFAHVGLLGPCFKAGRMGSQLADAKSAQVPSRARPVVARHPPRSARAAYPRAGSSARAWVARDQRRSAPESAADRLSPSTRSTEARIARPHPLPSRQFQALFDSLFKLSVSRRYLALGRNLPPYLGCIPKQPDFADKRLAVGGGVRAQRGCHPLWRPIPWDLRPVRRRGRFCRLQFERRKPLDSHTGLFPFARPLLGESFGCSHLTWGRNPEQGLRSAGGNCRQGVLLSRGLGPRLEPRRAREGGATTVVVPKCPWGKVFFQPTSPGGKGDQSARPDDPPAPSGGAAGHGGGGTRRRGAQADFDGSRDSAIHTKYRIFASRSSSIARAKISVAESRVRLPCSRSDAKATPAWDRLALPLLTWHRSRPSGCSCVRVPDRRGRLDAEPVGARSLTLSGEGFDGRLAPAAPVAQRGIVCSFVKLGRARFVESTMILPQTKIAPPTKNGHAPPPIESRKSSQSVNPYYVWTCCSSFINPRISPLTMKYECPRLSLLIITPIPKANTIGPKSSGITAAAGTGLALQWILVKGFRLYSFQLPDSESPVLLFIVTTSPCQDWDQPGSILERPRTPQHADAKSASAPGQGHRRSSKSWAIRLRLRIQPSPSGLPHSHGSMNTFVASGVRAHPADYTSKASCPFREKHTSTRGMPATQQGRWRSVSEERKALARRRLIRPKSTTQRDVQRSTTRSAAAVRRPMPRPRHGEASKGAIGPACASQDRERGTEREELKAIAQRKRGANGLCTAHAEGQAIARSAAGGNKPFLGAPEGRKAFPRTPGANSPGLPPASADS
ncbi:hypothetical protein H6P81_021244 [Aristolochia fimbriata]|uniref:Uncharacterized protein n=1 Tax=Aristolochia fimbriata TaxID=158543 RepID=A0AAV7DRH3_ARIFI|nr:hypothetical protein H6P81_021244 [Aristolochia fimbriata]